MAPKAMANTGSIAYMREEDAEKVKYEGLNEKINNLLR